LTRRRAKLSVRASRQLGDVVPKAVFIACAILGAASTSASLAQQPRSFGAVDDLFSRPQATRGAGDFRTHCATCHTPAQAAQLMFDRGGGRPVFDYFNAYRDLMPPQSAQRPTAQGYVDIMAYLARTAGARMGASDVVLRDQAWRAAMLPAGVKVEAAAQQPAAALAWTQWRGDLAATAYSPATQIDRSNVGNLEIAWRWSGANFGPSPESRNITTPLMTDGVLFATAGLTRNVVAIDAVSGETLWIWRPQESPVRFRNAPRKGAGRGVAWWSDGSDKRVLTVTPGFHLVALDARTGQPVEGFGDHGSIDLMQGLRGAPQQGLPDIGSQSPPLVVGDVVVVGPAHQVSMQPKSKANVKGDVRGYDVRTGKLLWTFHTIPERGEPGYETWAKGSAEYTGNAGVWAPMSADLEAGAIFLPIESATGDQYGGGRKGANLYSSSLVSLDAKTGKLRWAQQLIHHDIWDWDTPAAPILADVWQGGETRKIVAQITKQAFVYVFDRNTGKPVWPIREVRIPKSDLAGEQAHPTQPMPTRPKAFDRQGASVDDLIDFTPELRAEAVEAVKPYRLGAFFAPPSLAGAKDGTLGTLGLPSAVGGGNWEGGAFDPETGLLYVPSMTQFALMAVRPAPEGSDAGYIGGAGPGPTVRGLPLVKPPYGRITAIDLNSGDHKWMIANGDTPPAIASNPALAGVSLPRTGVPTRAGLLATRTLLFAGEGEGGAPVLRAHDKATGEILAEIALPGAQTGLPMTYVWSGKQYVALAVSNRGQPAEIVALALPD
jgi:quinoprotein glucose dehydrogenase